MSAPFARQTVLCAAVALCCACSSGSEVAPDASGAGLGFAAVGDALTSGLDAGAASDAAFPVMDTGTTQPEIVSWDAGGGSPDSTSPQDGGGATTDPTCPDCGEPCNESQDCLYGWCVPSPDGDVCTKTCDADCPSGMSCREVIAENGDPVYICVYDHIFYCRPCHTHADCAPALLDVSPHRCVEHDGGAGSFCATACTETADCPDGGVCKLIGTGDDALSLCQPAADECTCTVASISVAATTPCSVTNGWGTCQGERMCADDGLTACDALEVSTETCNGLDDDCDGALDEDFPELQDPEPCDMEDDDDECATGAWTCVGGALVCNEWGGPTPELCNGTDDDCDDKVDEGFEQVGEACDGLDEDACLEGTWVCFEGDVACTDPADDHAIELCNDLDDDCDGAIDEAFLSLGEACDGEDDADTCPDGTFACVDGALACVDDPDELVELCNGLDDDCDGDVDEGFVGIGEPCDSEDEDLCADGTLECDGTALVCTDDLDSNPELCNNLDDDCDGETDEVWTNKGQPCDTNADTDGCQDGVWICKDDSTGLVCDDDAESVVETCNALDDDCDGWTDEDLLQPCTSPCGAGQEFCYEGTWMGCTAEEPIVCTDYDVCGSAEFCGASCPEAPAESCDLVDNDCDGETDEGHLGDSSHPILGDFTDSWSEGLLFMGVYPEDTSGTVTGKLLPMADRDWFTIEATESLSDLCLTDAQDAPITGTVLLNGPTGTVDYEVCACWSSKDTLCAKSTQLCETSFNGDTAQITIEMSMQCLGGDLGYLDILIRPLDESEDHACDDWSLSWQVQEG